MVFPSELPHFEDPPVIEVVCGIQFNPLNKFQTYHFGAFLERVRDQYPYLEDRPPLDDVFEADHGTSIKGEFSLVQLPPLRRVFYVDQSRRFLLQLQPSRFLSNWRKQSETEEYPRFTAAFRRFCEGISHFRAFVAAMELGPISINQYELSYINHFTDPGCSFPEEIQTYMPIFNWCSGRTIDFLPTPSSASLRLDFALPESRGRLHLAVGHGARPGDGEQILVADFTARGPATSPDGGDLDEWFLLAHEWIVRGFTDLTSAEAHKRWRRAK